MTDRDDDNERIEREIRGRRGFDLAGALARRDGGGHLKGASPTPLLRRAALNLEQWLETRLDDGEGALRLVVLRQLADRPDLLSDHPERPDRAVAAWLPPLLADRSALAELVRQADVEWGRIYQERPHFERGDHPADPEDPYTREDVARRLADLLARARAEAASG